MFGSNCSRYFELLLTPPPDVHVFPFLISDQSAEKALIIHYHSQQLALMEDRLLVEDHGYQLYGTQLEFDTISKRYKLLAIKDEEHVNERRKEMGMGPLEEYLKIYNIEYLPPKKRKNNL